MDHADAREWRVFHEKLKAYQLTGQESPQNILIKFWQQELQLHGEANQKQFKEFAKLLIAAHGRNLTHRKAVNSIVLWRFMGDIFASQAKEFVGSVGVNVPDINPLPRVTDIFQAFIKLKASNRSEEIMASLQKLAVQSMFASHNFDRFFSLTTPDDLSNSEFVHADQNDLIFNYPFMKQYFAAQFFFGHLNDSSVIEFVMRTFFTTKDYTSICWFLDDYFAGDLPSASDVMAKFEKFLYDNWLPGEKKFVAGFPDVYSVLCKLLESKMTAIYVFLFRLLKRRPLILRQVLLIEDDTSILKCGVKNLEPDDIADLIAQLPKEVLEGHLVRTINEGGLVTMVNRNDEKTLGYFLEFIRNSFETDQLVRVLLKNHEGFNVLLKSANPSHGGEIFKYLVENLDENVLTKLIRSKSQGGSNMLHLALHHFSHVSLESLVATLKICGVLKAQSLETNNVDNNVLHKAIENKSPDVLTYLIDTVLKVELTNQELLDLMTGTDKKGRNILHLAVFDPLINLETTTQIFETVERHVDTLTFQQMLMLRLKTGENVLRLAGRRGDHDLFRFVHARIVEKINDQVAIEMLHSRYNGQANIVVSLKPNLKVSKTFLPIFEDLFSLEDLKELLLGELADNRNIFHVNCKFGQFDNFRFIFDYLKKKFDEADVHNLLLARDLNAYTILHLAAGNPHYGFFRELVDFIGPKIGVAAIRSLLRSRTIFGSNILHIATVTSQVLIFEDVVAVVKSQLPAEYIDMLSSRNSLDQNLIGMCLLSDEQNVKDQMRFFKFLVKFLGDELGPEEVRKMLLNTDEFGQNIMQAAVKVDVRLFKFVLEHLETVFDLPTVQRLLLGLDHAGESILHDLEFDKIYKIVIQRVDVQPLLRAIDAKDDTIVRWVFSCPNPKAVTILEKEIGRADLDKMLQLPEMLLLLCNIIKNVTRDHSMMCNTIEMVAQRLGVEVLKQMAVHKGILHINAFMHLCQGYLGRCEIVEIFECLHKHVGPKFFTKVLTAINSRSGENVFFCLVGTNLHMFQHIVEYLNDKLGADVVRKMLLVKNIDENETLTSRAAKHSDGAIFSYLLSLFQSHFQQAKLVDLLLNRLKTEIQCNNFRQLRHWFEYAQQLSLDEIFDKTAAGKLINSVARYSDPISINEFLKITGFEIDEIVVDWPAVLRHAAFNPSTLVLAMFIDACKRVSNGLIVVKTLCTVDIKGSLLHCVLESGNLTSVKYMFDILLRELPEPDFKAVLMSTNKKGQNLMAPTVVQSDKVSFNLLLTLLRPHVDRESLRNMLITNKENVNILVDSLRNPSLVHFVLQKLQEELGHDDAKSMLLQTDPLDNDSNVLHRYFRTGMKFYMCFVLDFLESVLDQQDINSLLCDSTNYDNNIIHVAFINSSGSNIEFIFQFLRKYLGQEKLRELLCGETKHGSKVFHIAVKKTTVNCLSRIYDQLVFEFGNNTTANELLLADNRFQQNILYIAARMGLPKYFPHVVDFIRSKSSDECVKRMALQVDESHENLFHAAARNPDPKIFSIALKCLQPYCGEATIRTMIRAMARNCYNILHFAVRSDGNLLPIYEFCQFMFGALNAKRMLCAGVKHGQNILQIAARFGARFRSIFGWLKALLNASEFHNLLTLNNRPGDTVFVACLEFDHYDGLKEIVDCYLEEIGLDTLKSVLSAPGFVDGALCRMKNADALQCLVGQLSRFFDLKTIYGWLLSFDQLSLRDDKEKILTSLTVQIDLMSFLLNIKEFKELVLHMTILTEDSTTLENLVKHMTRKHPSMLSEATRVRLTNGDNIGHSAIRTNDLDMASKVFECLENYGILSESVLEQNSDGLSVLALAVESGREDLFLLAMEFVAKFDISTREKLVETNILHSIAKEFKNSVVNKAFGVFFKDMAPEVITSYFSTRSRNGLNLFEICILQGNIRSVQNIGNENVKILQVCTKNQENAFHLAARSGKAEMLKCILENAKAVMSLEEVEASLTAVDASGSNILHMVALKNDKKLMETSIELLNPELGTDKVKEMVAAENQLGHSVDAILDFFADDVEN